MTAQIIPITRSRAPISFYPEYQAMAEQPASESVQAQRDNANARANALREDVADLRYSLHEMKELFRFALLGTAPEIARDGMEFVRKAERLLERTAR